MIITIIIIIIVAINIIIIIDYRYYYCYYYYYYYLYYRYDTVTVITAARAHARNYFARRASPFREHRGCVRFSHIHRYTHTHTIDRYISKSRFFVFFPGLSFLFTLSLPIRVRFATFHSVGHSVSWKLALGNQFLTSRFYRKVTVTIIFKTYIFAHS